MRLFLILTLATLAGCFHLPALSDAGAASCSDGGTGPLGICASCEDACNASTDCDASLSCLRGANGCLSCSPEIVDAGPTCQSAPCRMDSDCCGPGQGCIAPGEILCGGPACPPPTNECGPQNPCGVGQQCVNEDACCTGANASFHCVTACTAASCSAGEVCNADAGCVPALCTEGFKCPADATCNPDAGDEHGCVLTSCAGDPDCPGGFCVDGSCQSQLGVCQSLPV